MIHDLIGSLFFIASFGCWAITTPLSLRYGKSNKSNSSRED